MWTGCGTQGTLICHDKHSTYIIYCTCKMCLSTKRRGMGSMLVYEYITARIDNISGGRQTGKENRMKSFVFFVLFVGMRERYP